MKNHGSKILSGIPQGLNYTAVGVPETQEKYILDRFLLMNNIVLENAPLHIAVHIISDLDTPVEPYAQIHCHQDCDEIGLIVAPKDALEYEIILEGEEHRVKSPAAVYIPAGTYHRAKAVSGTGAYVCIILDPRGPHEENVQVKK